MSSSPPTKKMKQEEDDESNVETLLPRVNRNKNIINSLPVELSWQPFRMLSVVDRLKCAGMSPRLSEILNAEVDSFQQRILSAETKHKVLNAEVLFEGFKQDEKNRFGTHDLISLLHQAAEQFNSTKCVVELDLHSFGPQRFRPFGTRIAKSLKLFPDLEILNITDFDLVDFVNFLPPTLRTLKISGEYNVQTLETLSKKCPNLEEVPFLHFQGLTYEIVNGYLRKFQRLKLLDALGNIPLESGSLTTVQGLRELEVLTLCWDFVKFDEKTVEVITTECTKLRKICIKWTHFYTDAGVLLTVKASSLFQLAKMPSLTVLELFNDHIGTLTDQILAEIARRGQLKKLRTNLSILTDDSIAFLISKCKSLVSLDLTGCDWITGRSLAMVIAELQRRHGYHPRSLPNGPLDPGVFYFRCFHTQIDLAKANEFAVRNPWLCVESNHNHYDSREII